MRSLLYSIFSFLVVMTTLPAFAQQGSWPKVITTAMGTEIKIFEFQPQSLTGNNLHLQAAVSIKETSAAEPVFGMLWADAAIQKDGSNRMSRITELNVSNLKIPGVSATDDVNELKEILQDEIPKFQFNIPVSELLSAIQANQQQSKLAGNINTTPPKIIYTKTASILVYIDGEPQIQKNAGWGVDQVVNTPFTIIKNNDNRYYLYGNKKWYSTNNVTGTWTYTANIPPSLAAVDQEVRKADTTEVTNNAIPNVIVTTEPAELIQSKGEPNFAPVQGTNLLYMTNTANDVFLDINSQQYYVLISGRWYKASNLNSNWTYTASDNLPADFVKIPEGSSKDAVLASIAGTAAAEESVLDAQVPQTAKVDRNTATANVDYDGEPQFEQIEGTDLKYATNTPGAVINDGRKYYYVENGVWFESNSANGPWQVATERPGEVANIPPSSPVYNVKYVYIYDATPDYVYMGYTPGYLGTYIYGNTIVYGTGYRYRPWRGRYYYARPTTWGFNMRYNPWSGWNFGIGFGSGWFYSEIGNYNYFGQRIAMGGCSYGWWGQSVYRPQYARRNGNYYGRNVVINNNYIVNNNRGNNVYRSRRDVVTYDRSGYDTRRNNRNGGYAQNTNNRGGNEGTYNNNGGRNQRGEATGNGRSVMQRPGRFGRTENGSNANVNNNRGGNQPSGTLPRERPSRVYNPQGNAGNVADNNNENNRINRPANPNGRFGSRPRQTEPSGDNPVIANPGNRVGRNERPAPSQGSGDDNQVRNNIPSRPQQQRNGNTQPNINEDRPRLREINAEAGSGQMQRPEREAVRRNIESRPSNLPQEQQQRNIPPQRNQEAPAPQQPQRTFNTERRSVERNAGAEQQPQRVYRPGPAAERQQSNPAPVQRQPEVQRSVPSASQSPATNGGGERPRMSRPGRGN